MDLDLNMVSDVDLDRKMDLDLSMVLDLLLDLGLDMGQDLALDLNSDLQLELDLCRSVSGTGSDSRFGPVVKSGSGIWIQIRIWICVWI